VALKRFFSPEKVKKNGIFSPAFLIFSLKTSLKKESDRLTWATASVILFL
jgi:hypothetical protein